MTHGEHLEAALRGVQKKIALLGRGIITPIETAEMILDSLAHAQAYEIVHQVAEMLPGTVHVRLKLSVEDILKPGSPLRTFQGHHFSTKEEQAKYDIRIHSQFVRVAMSLREYWKPLDDQP